MTACSGTVQRSKPYELVNQNHPLAGKIWNVKEQRFADKTELTNSVLNSRYVLLGETHDNQVHHKHQQWVIDSVIKKDRAAGVAFEMISNLQAEHIKKETEKSGVALTTAKLIDLLEKDKSGWQYRIFYQKIFDSVTRAGVPLYPANLDRGSLLKLLKKGGSELPAGIREQLDQKPISPSLKETLTEEIKKSHCGMANPGMVSAMMLGQRVRDIIMSDSLFENYRKKGNGKADDNSIMLFVGGSGHTRKDRGIPVFLQQRDSDSKILSMAWLEVFDDGQQATDYAKFWGAETMPFDYVWFTAHVDRPDPCEQMRRYMEKRQQKKEET